MRNSQTKYQCVVNIVSDVNYMHVVAGEWLLICFHAATLIQLFDARGPQNQFEFYVEDSIDFDRFGL